MTAFPVPIIYPPLMPWQDHVRNGLVPDWRSAAGVIQRNHFALAHCRKCVFMKATRPGATPQGQGSTTVPWRWYFRTGEAVASGSTIKLRAECLVLPADNASATDPRFQIDLNSGTLTSNIGRYPLVDTSPDYGSLQRVVIDVNALAPNTAYESRLDVIDYARVVSMTVYELVSSEVNTSATYVSDPTTFALDAAITDAQHLEYLQDQHAIWKHNGAHLLTLVPDDINSKWTRTSATPANLLDQSITSTTAGANTPGWNFQAQYLNPFHTNNVECVLAVYGSNPNALSAGGFSLFSSASEFGLIEDFDPTPAWKTSTFNLDGSIADNKLDPFFYGDGTNATTIESVCIYTFVT